MGKYNRRTVGSILKGELDEKTGVRAPDYLKLRGDMKEDLLKAVAGMGEKGLNFKLENKESQLKSLDQAEKDGKISSENAAKARERINKIPEFVRFEVVLLEKK